MNNTEAKGVCIAILFVLTVLFGWLPIWLHHRGSLAADGSVRRKLLLDLMNCFAGGIFLGACLLQLLTEGRRDFEEYKEMTHFHSNFPFYETFTGVGLFLVALTEKVCFMCLPIFTRTASDSGEASRPSKGSRMGGSCGGRDRPGSLHRGYGAVSSTEESTTSSSVALHSCSDSEVRGHREVGIEVAADFFIGEERPVSDEHRPLTSSMRLPLGQGRCLESSSQDLAEQEHHHHHHSLLASASCRPADLSQVSLIRALMLLIALSFHTVFDGLAVGLQSSISDVWQMLAAIAVHKSLVSFCLGLDLATAISTTTTSNGSSSTSIKRPLVFMFLFSLIAPLGIGVGMGVTSSHVNVLVQLLVSSILQALATGTFMYVTFFEIMGQQFAHSHAYDGTWVSMGKIFSAFCGFACMAGVKLLNKI